MLGDSIRIGLVFIHMIAAAIWIGGTIFVAVVLVPAIRRTDSPRVGVGILRDAVRRFSRISWVMLAVLILSGVGLLERRDLLFDDVTSSAFWSTELGTVLAIKVFLVVVVLVLSAVHDFVLGPRLASVLESIEPGARPSPDVARMRRRLVSLARLNLLLVLAIVALGTMLFRGVPG